jgi:hypothetical protein
MLEGGVGQPGDRQLRVGVQPEEDRTAAAVGQGRHVPAHLIGVVDASQREDLAIGRARGAGVGHAVIARHIGDEGHPQPVEVVAGKELEQRVEGGFRQHHLGGPVADFPSDAWGHPALWVRAVRVGALHAEHAPLVAQIGAIVPMRAGKALELGAVKRAEFQRLQAGILRRADAQRARGQVIGNGQHPPSER